ncbi:MAG: hypothetical protein PWQ79_430 [Thermococcaceae archaeon]|nr:hypothetical protein [Thermococcaceae archaeon]MDK2913515.1 hypothetical protein [Thermococcaceae archaeon]
MAEIVVEPPEYYPIVDKFFATPLVEGLQVLGVDVIGIKAGVQTRANKILLGFIIETGSSPAIGALDVDSIVSSLLEKLAKEATYTWKKLQDVSFEVVGFKVYTSRRRGREEKTSLVVNSPEDLRRGLERLGKGLMIYLKERRAIFSTIVIKAPMDGRPVINVTLLLREVMNPLEKQRLQRELSHKVESFLRTLSLDYLRFQVSVLDPEDEKISLLLREKEKAEKMVDNIAEKKELKELMRILGKKTP